MKNILFALCVGAIFSCKQQPEAAVKTAPTQVEKAQAVSGDLNETIATTQVTFTTEEATLVHRAYLELKAALVNTDASEAAKAAGDFKNTLGAIAEDALLTNLKNELERIAESGDAKEQRISFETVSYNVETYLSDKIASGALIKQYCPMAFDGKGAYWLSDSQEIRNPYFGDVMLKCGVVDKEIQ